MCEVDIAELRRVLRDPFRASAALIDSVVAELRDQVVVPKPLKPSPVPVRDPDDRWVLASAVAGEADLLVTGDQDLLDVAAQPPVAIVNPRGCWDRLRER